MSKVTPVKIRGKDFWYVDEILDTRLNGKKREFLVHWTDTSPTSATWEPEKNLKKLDLLKEFLEKHPEIEASNMGSAKGKGKRKASNTPARDKEGSTKRRRSGRTTKSSANDERTESIPVDFKELLKQHLESESPANLQKSEASNPLADRYSAFDALTQQVSREHASLLFPTEAETECFFEYMPDFDAILAATENTIAAANQPLAASQSSTKRSIPSRKHSLTSEMASSSNQSFVLGSGQVMAGFSNIPSSSTTSQTEAAAGATGPKTEWAQKCFANIFADFEEFSFSREKRDYMVSAFKALIQNAKDDPKSFEENAEFDWEAMRVDQENLARRAEIRSTTVGKDLLDAQLANEMTDSALVLRYLANGSV